MTALTAVGGRAKTRAASFARLPLLCFERDYQIIILRMILLFLLSRSLSLSLCLSLSLSPSPSPLSLSLSLNYLEQLFFSLRGRKEKREGKSCFRASTNDIASTFQFFFQYSNIGRSLIGIKRDTRGRRPFLG